MLGAAWYCMLDGEQHGPFDDEQLRRMIAEGRLGVEDLVWRDGMSGWVPVRSVTGMLASSTGSPTAAVAAGATAGDELSALAIAAAGYAAGTVADERRPVVVEDDPGPFTTVGSLFDVGGGDRWVGKVVASPRAFYLLKVRQDRSPKVTAALLQDALARHDDTRTCRVDELPRVVRQQLDAVGDYPAGDVIVLPRQAVSRVDVYRLNNVVNVRVRGQQFGLITGLFIAGKVRGFLESNGWVLNRDVTPTAAAIHGAGYGRAPGEPPAAGMSVGMRILYVAIAVLVVALIIALRASTGRYSGR